MHAVVEVALDGAPGNGRTYYVVCRGGEFDYEHVKTFRSNGYLSQTKSARAAAEKLRARINEANITEAHCEESPHWKRAVAYSYNKSDGSDGVTPVLTHTWRSQ